MFLITFIISFDTELLVITHTLNFHQGYNYMLAVEPCNDCIEGIDAYLPMGQVGKFNKLSYMKEKKKWATRSRVTTELKDKDCKGEESSLLISFSNVHVDIQPDSIRGYVDLRAKTTETSKVLHSISSKIKYSSDIFGPNVIVNQNLNIHPVVAQMEQSYTTQAIDVASDKANFSTTKNSSSAEAMLIDTIYQSLIRLNFKISVTNISELPNNLDELFQLEELGGSFLCEGREQTFTRITVEDNPIGIAVDEKLTSSINYTIDNVEFDQASQDYFFTIFASSSETTLLRQSILRFDYSSSTFFSNQVASGNVQIINEPGTIVADNPQQYGLIQSDLDNDSYRLVIGDINVPQPGAEYAVITPEPIPLVKIKFETQNCAQNPMLSFQELEMQGISYHFDEDLFPFFAIAYEPVVANDFEQVPPCGCEEVNIDSYSPEEIVAGDNQVLTITGSNFGVYQRGVNPGMDGTGSSVLFKNGDYTLPAPGNPNPNAPPEFIGAGESDFIIDGVLKWTDTEIQVKVPSTDWQLGFFGPAATGKFIVRNGCNDEDQHPGLFQNLRIPHSLLNTRLGNEDVTKRLGLRNDNGLNSEQDGYEFEFHPNVSMPNVNIDIKEAFKNALETWCEKTSIRFKVKNETSPNIAIAPGDGRNSIVVEDFQNAAAQASLVVGQHFDLDCGGSNPENESGGFIMTDLDFRVNSTFAAESMNQSRALRVFEHELGHAHMLNHAFCFGAFCSGPLMHPQGDSGIKDADIDGGNKIFDDSQIILSNSCFLDNVEIMDTQPIQSGNCGQVVTIKELSNYYIKINPNPTFESILIEGISESIDFKLINTTGQILKSGKKSDGFSIQLSEYPQGAYWLNIANKTENVYFKIIKL